MRKATFVVVFLLRKLEFLIELGGEETALSGFNMQNYRFVKLSFFSNEMEAKRN